jgi:hypothetical protein
MTGHSQRITASGSRHVQQTAFQSLFIAVRLRVGGRQASHSYQFRQNMIRLSKHWDHYRLYGMRADVPTTNNGTESDREAEDAEPEYTGLQDRSGNSSSVPVVQRYSELMRRPANKTIIGELRLTKSPTICGIV